MNSKTVSRRPQTLSTPYSGVLITYDSLVSFEWLQLGIHP